MNLPIDIAQRVAATEPAGSDYSVLAFAVLDAFHELDKAAPKGEKALGWPADEDVRAVLLAGQWIPIEAGTYACNNYIAQFEHVELDAKYFCGVADIQALSTRIPDDPTPA